MDDRYSYSTASRVHLAIYVAEGYDPPATIMLEHDGQPVEFMRLSDMSLVCEKVAFRIDSQGNEVPVHSECGSYDCHRLVLGQCKCGRHPAPVRFAKAT
jgi:hypothetical protein